MTARPILFNGPMVRAILDGRKTQTRRVVKAIGKLPLVNLAQHANPLSPGPFSGHHDDPMSWGWPCIEDGCHAPLGAWLEWCPYGAPGDRLRVKEAAWMWCERRPAGTTPTGRKKWRYVPMREAPVIYQADHPYKPQTSIVSPETGNEWGWRLKIGRFLPAWASRITLEVTGVRVERLQDISEEDALAEGICDLSASDSTIFGLPGENLRAQHPVRAFWLLWESINGPDSWGTNPWVWAVEFKRV